MEHIMLRRGDAAVAFRDLVGLMHALGFNERVRGDHHIFTREGIREILNFQPRKGMAKPYQVRQVRGIILSYGLDVEDD